jgi:molybdopterin converting factor small subunit
MGSLVEKLHKEYEGKVAEVVAKSTLLILVNGQNIEFLGGQDSKLSDGDRIAMTLVVAGR